MCKYHLHTYIIKRAQTLKIVAKCKCNAICFNFFPTETEPEEICTACPLYLSCTTCSSVFLRSDPGSDPRFPSVTGQSPGLGAASSNKSLLLNFVQSCWPSDSLFSLSWHLLSCLHLKHVSHPYSLFDISVRCFFPYCCPTLVVRRAVLLSKTLDRWTGLYYPRWVSCPAANKNVIRGRRGMLKPSSWMKSIKHKLFSYKGDRHESAVNPLMCLFSQNQKIVQGQHHSLKSSTMTSSRYSSTHTNRNTYPWRWPLAVNPVPLPFFNVNVCVCVCVVHPQPRNLSRYLCRVSCVCASGCPQVFHVSPFRSKTSSC